MLSLRDAQAAFATTVREGPDQYPDGMFTGTRDRALLGLKVHANTISHARLIALEETFPLTRAEMGEGAFNAASRAWLDAGYGCDCPLALIGAGFADWLASTLARFEWLWLESYHAAEAAPLRPEAMQATTPEALLALTIAPHPAARLTTCNDRIADLLGLPESPAHLLIARPEADVLVHALTAPLFRLFTLFNGTANLGEVLETFWAELPNDDAVAGINHLISLGALTMENVS